MRILLPRPTVTGTSCRSTYSTPTSFTPARISETHCSIRAAENGTLDRFPAAFLTRKTLSWPMPAGSRFCTWPSSTVISIHCLPSFSPKTVFCCARMPGVRCYTRRHRGAPATSARLGFESQQFGPSQQVRLYPIPAPAETGRRGKIPPTTRTVDLLLTCNEHGDAPLHAAAHEGGVSQSDPVEASDGRAAPGPQRR